MKHLYLVLQALTATFALAALVFVAWPASLPSRELPPAIPAPPVAVPAPPASADSALGDVVVAHDIFSRSRTAPKTRYRPTTAANETQAMPSTVPTPAAAPDSASGVARADSTQPAASSTPQLYGILSGPNGATALIDLDPAIPGAEMYHVGDRHGRYTVAEITATTVVLRTPRGLLVLHLKEKTP